MSPADLGRQQDRALWVLGAGVIGGLVIGSWGVKHLFGEGLEERERQQMLYGGIVGLFIGGMMLLDVDKKWWDLETQADWLAAEVQGAMK